MQVSLTKSSSLAPSGPQGEHGGRAGMGRGWEERDARLEDRKEECKRDGVGRMDWESGIFWGEEAGERES